MDRREYDRWWQENTDDDGELLDSLPEPVATLAAHAQALQGRIDRLMDARPVNARGLCDSCYEMHWKAGTHTQFPTKRVQRFRADFVADYDLLRSEGYTRSQIAARLGMTRNAVDRAVQRAVAAGDLDPDRRTA